MDNHAFVSVFFSGNGVFGEPTGVGDSRGRSLTLTEFPNASYSFCMFNCADCQDDCDCGTCDECDPPTGPTFTVAASQTVNATAANLVHTVNIGGDATGNVTLANWSSPLPAGVTVNVTAATATQATITVVDGRPAGVASPVVDFSGTVSLVRQGVTATTTLGVTINLPPVDAPGADTFTAVVSAGQGTLSQTLTFGGSITTGDVTLGNWTAGLPAGLNASLAGNILTITDTRGATAPAINHQGTVAMTRGTVTVQVPVTITIAARGDVEPTTFTVATASVAITQANLTATVTVGGSATGEISLSGWSPALPAGITASVSNSGATSATITFVDNRPAGVDSPAINWTGTVSLQREGVTATPPLNVTINRDAIGGQVTPSHLVTVVGPGNGGTASSSPTGEVQVGATVTISVQAPQGLVIEQGTLQVTGATGIAINHTLNTATFTMPNNPVTITVVATFREPNMGIGRVTGGTSIGSIDVETLFRYVNSMSREAFQAMMGDGFILENADIRGEGIHNINMSDVTLLRLIYQNIVRLEHLPHFAPAAAN
jgi:hypothetical protein